MNSSRFYFIDQSKGTQDHSDCHGNVVRAFDSNLTGKYDYDKRAELQKGLPANFGGVELPKSLEFSMKRVYSPEHFHFEGYSQFPKPVANPYTNDKLLLTRDFVAKRRSREAMHQLNSMREIVKSKWNKKLLNNLDSFAFQTNNVGTSFLTGPENYIHAKTVVDMMKTAKNKLFGDIKKFYNT